jgi:hypothetical protein
MEERTSHPVIGFMRYGMRLSHIFKKHQRASLTVEAALILPIFMYFMLAFLYFIQIFTVQERIQASITRMGMNLSKAAYIFQDFPNAEETLNFDFSIFNNEFEFKTGSMADKLASKALLKLYAQEYLDNSQVNNSCIMGGFDGLSFDSSDIMSSGDDIDIVVSYKVRIPVKIFVIDEMQMVQRVRLRKWTGYEVAAAYSTETETGDESIVYITESGSVYHADKSCSHIRLSVRAVSGIPKDLRNDSGAKYYPCEACCGKDIDESATYYITSDGTRFHSKRECSKIKRNVREIKLSEIGSRAPCKRCSQ